MNARISLHHGDCLDVLRTLPDSSFDSCVTDPPYALVSIAKRFGADSAAPAKAGGATGVYQRASAGFMGQKWDTGERAFAIEFWAEVLRVLKPGAHVIAFGGTRTYHRLACAIEDAGFEIRDSILDLMAADESVRVFMASLSEAQLDGFIRCIEGSGLGGVLAWIFGTGFPKSHNQHGVWEGWGTALKPAFEPQVLARKPLDGTVAGNLALHGVGAINIDGCRIGHDTIRTEGNPNMRGGRFGASAGDTSDRSPSEHTGRWPANVIHDGSDEVVATFPQSHGQQGDVTGAEPSALTNHVYGSFNGRPATRARGDSGSAARFFYSAKAATAERFGSKHPTVKPIELMAYLCRLVTPPGGAVLEPFGGSGSTAMACLREGFRCTIIEREAEYVADIKRRIGHVSGTDLPLFGTSILEGQIE